jgi:hypothetical protein
LPVVPRGTALAGFPEPPHIHEAPQRYQATEAKSRFKFCLHFRFRSWAVTGDVMVIFGGGSLLGQSRKS